MKRYNSLASMKLIFVLGMIIYHCGAITEFDYGTYACQFFFIVSGALVGIRYNDSFHLNDEIIKFYTKKIKGTYPSYFIAFLLSIPFQFMLISSRNELFEALYDSIFHLTMSQAWFPDMTFKYNAIAWFTSALFFCYIFTPLLCIFFRERTFTGKVAITIGLFVLRVLLEIGSSVWPNSFTYSIHSNPAIRLVEYSIGMCLGNGIVLWESNKNIMLKTKEHKISWSVAEMGSICICIGGMLAASIAGYKFIAIFPICVLIGVFAMENGGVSYILSNRWLLKLSNYQGEIYIFHYVIIRYAIYIFKTMAGGVYNSKFLFALICICGTIFAAYIYKILGKLWSRVCGIRKQVS